MVMVKDKGRIYHPQARPLYARVCTARVVARLVKAAVAQWAPEHVFAL